MQIQATMDAATELQAQALCEGVAVSQTLTHLAVGDGSGAVPIDPAARSLQHEIGRALFLHRAYCVPDVAGAVRTSDGQRWRELSPTAVDAQGRRLRSNFLYLVFRFGEDDALGTWSELALYGGGVTFVTRGALMVDGARAGDDRANVEILLGGSYAGADSQTITITVTAAGGSGVAHIGWASNGSAPSGSATVAFGVPVALTGTGLTLTFTGGGDSVLTLGDQWRIQATRESDSSTFASGGVYDPVANPMGQVRTNGDILRVWHDDAPQVKDVGVVDVPLVHKVLNQ